MKGSIDKEALTKLFDEIIEERKVTEILSRAKKPIYRTLEY